MAKQNYTHLTLVVDISGSMLALAQAATEGINDILLEQTKEFGEFTYSLVEFSLGSQVVARNAKDPIPYVLRPNGGTALYDAIGFANHLTIEDIEKLPESEQPEDVIFIIVTDGEENASRENSAADVRQMIESGRAKGWRYQFIGAEESAYQADQLGADRTRFNRNDRGMKSAYRTMNEEIKIRRMLEEKEKFLFSSEIDDNFSDNYDADKDSM